MIQYSDLYKRHEISELVKNLQGFGEPTPEEQEMMAFQQQVTIQRMTLEVQELEADIAVKSANARKLMADADSKDGYNEAAMELKKLETQLQLKQMDLGGRIALAARSHQNAQLTNDKRNIGQMALKGLDLANIDNTQQEQKGQDNA